MMGGSPQQHNTRGVVVIHNMAVASRLYKHDKQRKEGNERTMNPVNQVEHFDFCTLIHFDWRLDLILPKSDHGLIESYHTSELQCSIIKFPIPSAADNLRQLGAAESEDAREKGQRRRVRLRRITPVSFPEQFFAQTVCRPQKTFTANGMQKTIKIITPFPHVEAAPAPLKLCTMSAPFWIEPAKPIPERWN